MFSRNGFHKVLVFTFFALIFFQIFPKNSLSIENNADPIIYGVNYFLPMGNPGEVPRKDFYINIGTNQGIKVGSNVEVLRKMPTFDLISKRLEKDMLFPIAKLKVIHVEQSGAIARLDKMLPEESTPMITPNAVMVGDSVRLANGK